MFFLKKIPVFPKVENQGILTLEKKKDKNVRLFLIVFHILITLILIGIILLQRGGDDDYGGSSTAPKGGKNGLTTITSIFGGIFFVNCLSLAILISRDSKLQATSKDLVEKQILEKKSLEKSSPLAKKDMKKNEKKDIKNSPGEPISPNTSEKTLIQPKHTSLGAQQKVVPMIAQQKTTPVVAQEKTTPAVTQEKTTPAVTQEKTTPVVAQEKTTPAVAQEKTTPAVAQEKPQEKTINDASTTKNNQSSLGASKAVSTVSTTNQGTPKSF